MPESLLLSFAALALAVPLTEILLLAGRGGQRDLSHWPTRALADRLERIHFN